MGVYPWPQTNEWGFVLVSSMSEAICQASAHTESVVGYGRLGKTTGRDERDLLPICDQDDCGPLVSLSTHFGGFQSDAIDSSSIFLSYGLYVCLCAWRAARGGPRRARVRPKTQAEMRQQQSAVGHNPLMLVTVFRILFKNKTRDKDNAIWFAPQFL